MIHLRLQDGSSNDFIRDVADNSQSRVALNSRLLLPHADISTPSHQLHE